ncbi:Asp23/Gls24 family envelope stress response protein [Amycolatopsis sp. OK19-0408]|uniref:Asp23/Gls24 family envelope stress response protein n=1 Tax=Amycolatopsis iheyensis TaxID=2945988 RepID=A0A9X2SKU7_9PSEU|nr:Asp23/Gls24 family envelope stress response protein [Amycolatopsis iheyensis]MCR6486112.1 Asp23/Gls24 family envelope stress response protein [Amycolatopsis iheyensis]
MSRVLDVPRELAEPAERGTLTIGHAVVRKVAQHAADQVPGTTQDGKKGAKAKVGGVDNDVDLALDLALQYPAPVRKVVGVVREKVTEEVERITAYQVRTLAVTVSALLPATAPRVR